MKNAELRARLNGVPVLKCLNHEPHKSHSYREFEIQFCPGVKRLKKRGKGEA